MRYLCLFAFSLLSAVACSQHVVVDKEGVMRWSDSRKEVYGFGINYTVPFAHAYRSAGKLNVDRKKAIDEDVYHFARLGFDAFRVHVWDTEISDSAGNLLDNDHLRLFDYQLAKMKERGMKMIITPIAFWGNGWPERDEKTPGFSHKFGKDACLTNEEAIRAQERYLFQFLNHVNTYTGLPYKDDPDILAFEVSNEPHHRGAPVDVTTYINRMVSAMERTGTRKPIFYNISHSIHMAEAYFKSKIRGGTFQWYPTGLGARHELRGNFLPNVDNYRIPFADHPGFRSRAKIVYEFDAADVGRSYVYPAMARSFRTAGIQWAAHFSYDPTFMAYANTEYNTHYMNLVYTPQKAISLKIASEVFHQVPRYQDFGRFPGNTAFGNFRVSYEEDLAEMLTNDRFFYTNTTRSKPADTQALVSVAGTGSSPVVSYEGTGAYFLDRLEPGVWRLEVLPDAVWIDNPFGRNSLRKTIAVISWRSWPMTIRIPDLGEAFGIASLNKPGTAGKSANGTFEIMPGSYLLTKDGVSTKLTAQSRWRNITLGEFASPPTTVVKTHVVHRPPSEVSENQDIRVSATIVCPQDPSNVSLIVSAGRGGRPIAMKRERAYTYVGVIPAEMVQRGFLQYYIAVTTGERSTTFPSGEEGSPHDWDFFDNKSYRIPVVGQSSGISIFNASTDAEEVSGDWEKARLQLMPGDDAGRQALAVRIVNLSPVDPENPNADAARDFTFRYNFSNKISGRTERVLSAKEIAIRARTAGKPVPVQVALVTRQGFAYGATITLEPSTNEYVIALGSLKPVPVVILPRPYPTFLPYFFEATNADVFSVADVETLQISVGKGLTVEDAKAAGLTFSLESVVLR